jgi:hypothetical protein
LARGAIRRRRSFLKGAGAAAGALAAPLSGVGLVFGEGEGTPADPAAAPAALAPAYPPAGFAYGMQAHLYYQNPPQVLEYVRDAGFGWVKQQVRWSAVEVARGEYDWSQLDGIVGYAALMGIRVLLSVVTAPAWSRTAGDVDGPPDDSATFGAFLRTLAARYAGRAHAYEVWNEQNFAREWGGGRINAGEYVELLKVAYTAIKEADPGALVISGALTPTGFNDPNVAIDDVLYLQQMYAYQDGVLKTVCDAIGAHAGGFNNPPDDSELVRTVPSTTFKGHPSFYFKRVEQLRETMVLSGDGEKKMWITEFGWSTENKARGYEYGKDNDDAAQGQYLVRAFQLGRQWGWVDGMFVWNLNFQQIVGPDDEKFPFGIVKPDGAPRPAYTMLKFMAKHP